MAHHHIHHWIFDVYLQIRLLEISATPYVHSSRAVLSTLQIFERTIIEFAKVKENYSESLYSTRKLFRFPNQKKTYVKWAEKERRWRAVLLYSSYHLTLQEVEWAPSALMHSPCRLPPFPILCWDRVRMLCVMCSRKKAAPVSSVPSRLLFIQYWFVTRFRVNHTRDFIIFISQSQPITE